MKDLEKRVLAIESRNRKVELDKRWETSFARRILITVLTYAVVSIYLMFIENDKPFINALVPAIGYFLSTLLLGRARRVWERRRD